MKKVRIEYMVTVEDGGNLPQIFHPTDGIRDMVEFSSISTLECTKEEKDLLVNTLKSLPNPPYMDVLIEVVEMVGNKVIGSIETWSKRYEGEWE